MLDGRTKKGKNGRASSETAARYLDLSPESTPPPARPSRVHRPYRQGARHDKDHFECSTPPSASRHRQRGHPARGPAGARQGRDDGAWIFDMKAEGEPSAASW